MAAVEPTTTRPPHDHDEVDGAENTLRIAESDVLRTRRKFTHTSDAQRQSVIEWLEEDTNFQLLTGTHSGVPLVNEVGKKLKKTDGFRSLMRHVNARTNAQWTIDVTRSRYESLMAAFRKTRRLAERGELHVSASDRAKGITDVLQKLNGTCRFYDRLIALFQTGRPLDEGSVESVKAVNSAGMAESAASSPSTVADAIALAAAVTQVTLSVGKSRKVMEPEHETAVRDHLKHAERVILDTAGVTSYSSPMRRSPSPIAKRLKTRHQSSPGQQHLGADDKLPHATEPDSSANNDLAELVEEQEKTPPATAMNDAMKFKTLDLETQKLTLQREQMELQRREIALKEKELMAEECMRKQAMRAELTTKLVSAGKSFAEIKELLELLG